MKSRQVVVRMTPAMYEALAIMAEEDERTIAQTVRHAINVLCRERVSAGGAR